MGELSGHPRPIVPVKRYRTRSSVPKSERDGFGLRQDLKDDSDDGEEARNGLRKKVRTTRSSHLKVCVSCS
jgi:hypothetical protein